MKIYVITFIAVAGLSFSFATAPLDTLYWLLFALELPQLLFSIIAAIVLLGIGAILSLALSFPALAMIAFALIADHLDKGAGH